MPKSKKRKGVSANLKRRRDALRYEFKKLKNHTKIMNSIDIKAKEDALNNTLLEMLENHDNGTKVIKDEEFVKELRKAKPNLISAASKSVNIS